MPSESYRVELNLPDDSLFVMPDLRAGPANTHMQLPVPSWTASYSASTRRPFTVADAPSSPASSTASQKFEVKRLLSRPADLSSSPRPLTTFDTSSSTLAGPSSGATVKRSNSASRSLLRRRPSKGHTDSTPAPKPIPAPVGPRQRTTTAPALLSHSRPNPYSSSNSLLPFDSRQSALPPTPYTPNSIASAPVPTRTFPSSPGIAPSSASSGSTLTPASAYALAYAQRTRMAGGEEPPTAGRGRDRESDRSRSQTRGTSATPTSTPTRSPFEGVGTGRLVALGDPADESLSLTLTSSVPALALAGFGVAGAAGEPVPAIGSGAKREGVSGLTRKVSAKFGRRKVPRAERPSGMDVQSDGEQEVSWKEWNQEKGKAGLRGIGLTPAPTTVRLGEKIMSGEKDQGKARKRVSRHLSIEEFRDTRVENEMGMRFEMWNSRPMEGKREQDKGKERDLDRSAALRSEKKERVESETRSKEKETGRRERKFSATLGRTEGSRAARDESVGTGSQLSARKEDSHQREGHASSQLSNRHPSLSRKDDSRSKKTESRPDVAPRSNSTPGQGYPVAEVPRPTGTVSPESHKSGGGMLWRLVKKMSTGTLKEKRSSHPEKAPPVPRLPATLPSSRRSSVIDDYGEEVRPELSRFGASRSASGHPGSDLGGTHSGSGSTHSGPSSFSAHAGILPIGPMTQAHSVHQQHRHRSASGGRPSLTHEWRPSMTNESSVISTSPKSSFGRTQSPRTSMSSYVDVMEDVSPPPLPMPLVGKHIVAPCELAQYTPGLGMSSHHSAPHVSVVHREREQPTGSPSLPPPKRPARATQKPREKPAPGPASPPAPTSVPIVVAPPLSPTSPKIKPRPNVLRRPTRLGDDKPGSVSPRSPRSPRSASMGLPSPRGRSQVGARIVEAGESMPGESARRITRPRSSSLGTVFTFRELDGVKGKPKERLTEQEKVAKFEQLLEASDKAGGTLHAKLQDKLLSDTMRLSENYGSEAGGM